MNLIVNKFHQTPVVSALALTFAVTGRFRARSFFSMMAFGTFPNTPQVVLQAFVGPFHGTTRFLQKSP
jgi:hypothetical protein